MSAIGLGSESTNAGPLVGSRSSYDGLAGLSEADAAERLIACGRIPPQRSSRSYASIVRANVLTVFNAILAGFGALTLAFGDWRDALFLGVILANSGIGITQEVRAKRALDRLSLLVAPRATVKRGGSRALRGCRGGRRRRPRAARAGRSGDG